jgi:hypothetical protein
MTRISRRQLLSTGAGAMAAGALLASEGTGIVRAALVDHPTLSAALSAQSPMFASMRRYEGVTDPDAAGKIVQDGFVPIVASVPGLVAYFWIDGGEGVMASTSVFLSSEGPAESNRRAADFVRENLAPLLPNPPLITEGPVVATGMSTMSM